VTMYEGENDHSYICRGGNQSDQVKVSSFGKGGLRAIRRPPAAGEAIRPVIPISPSTRRFAAITATVFGGASDPNNSAYDNHFITDSELGVALPNRFKGERPKVRVFKGGRDIVCSIVDVGPWNTNDPYWETGTRPQAESGTDRGGRHTNKAGIDLTPAAASALGIDGKGLVDWEFVGAGPVGPFEKIPTTDPGAADLARRLKQLETLMANVSPNTVQDILRILAALGAAAGQQPGAGQPGGQPPASAANILQILSMLLGQRQASPPPTTPTPDPLQLILGALLGKASAPGPAPGPTTPPPLVLTPIDKMLGGEALAGKKTLIAVIAFVIQLVLQFSGVPGIGMGETAGNILTTLIGGFGGLGLVSKVDRVVQLLGMMAANKPAPPSQSG